MEIFNQERRINFQAKECNKRIEVFESFEICFVFFDLLLSEYNLQLFIFGGLDEGVNRILWDVLFDFLEKSLADESGDGILNAFVDFANVGFANVFNLNVDLLVGGVEAGVELPVVPEILGVGMDILNLRF